MRIEGLYLPQKFYTPKQIYGYAPGIYSKGNSEHTQILAGPGLYKNVYSTSILQLDIYANLRQQ